MAHNQENHNQPGDWDLISETETKAIDLLTPSFLDDLKHEEELPPGAAQKRSSVVFTFHSLHVAIN